MSQQTFIEIPTARLDALDAAPCWFCDAEVERNRRDGRSGLVMMFAAAMPFERMMQALCERHRTAFEYLYSLKPQRMQ